MGSRLSTQRGRDLYAFWGGRTAKALAGQEAENGSGMVLNCASVEYFRAVDRATLGLRVVTPVFLEDGPEGPRVVGVLAKRARGAIARFVIEHRLRDPGALAAFDAGGYAYDPVRSRDDAPVFLRAHRDEIAA